MSDYILDTVSESAAKIDVMQMEIDCLRETMVKVLALLTEMTKTFSEVTNLHKADMQ